MTPNTLEGWFDLYELVVYAYVKKMYTTQADDRYLKMTRYIRKRIEAKVIAQHRKEPNP